MQARWWLRVASPYTVVALVALTVGWPTLDFDFTGLDTLAHLASADTARPSNLVGLFGRDHLSAFADRSVAGSRALRPLAMLSYAVDRSLWGLDPKGFHATQLAIHVFNALLVVALAGRLRLSTPGRLLAGTIFAVHPVLSAALPPLAVRFEVMACTFTLAALLAVLRAVNASRPALPLLGFALLAAAALLAKETALFYLLPMPLIALPLADRPDAGARASRLAAGVLLAVVAVWAAARWHVLQGLGGYVSSGEPDLWRLPIGMVRFARALVFPYPLLVGGAVARWAGWALIALHGAALVAGCLLAAVRWARRSGATGRVSPSVPRRAILELAAVSIGTALVAYTAHYAARGIFKPLYLYTAIGYWSLAAAAIVTSPPRRLATRLTAGVFALTVILQILGSPAFRGWDRWPEAGAAGRAYLDRLARYLPDLPAGTTVHLVNVPHGIDCPVPRCLGKSYVLEDYPIEGWLRMTQPGSDVLLTTLTAVWLPDDGRLPRSRLEVVDDGATVVSTVDAERVEGSWTSRGAAPAVEIGGTGPPFVARIRFPERPALEGSWVLFDAWADRPVLVLGADGREISLHPAPPSRLASTGSWTERL